MKRWLLMMLVGGLMQAHAAAVGPREQGFDYNVGGTHAGHPQSYFAPYKNPQLEDGPRGENLTDRLGEEAVSLIRKHRDDPFFIYLSFYAVHTPIQGKQSLTEKYRKIDPAGGHNNPQYAAMIETMDDAVGRILDTLDELKLADDTLVIFISDNGGLGGYASMGLKKNRNITDNAPLKGGKGSFYEGGIRTPMIVRWPGVTEAGATCDTPVSMLDFYPTLTHIAGANPPADQPMDGANITPLFRGQSIAGRALYWHFPGYLQAYGPGAWRTPPVSVLRAGDYKLIEFLEDNRLELYNLADDVGERHNLVDTQPDKTRQLHDQLKAWRRRIDAPMPKPKGSS